MHGCIIRVIMGDKRDLENRDSWFMESPSFFFSRLNGGLVLEMADVTSGQWICSPLWWNYSLREDPLNHLYKLEFNSMKDWGISQSTSAAHCTRIYGPRLIEETLEILSYSVMFLQCILGCVVFNVLFAKRFVSTCSSHNYLFHSTFETSHSASTET